MSTTDCTKSASTQSLFRPLSSSPSGSRAARADFEADSRIKRTEHHANLDMQYVWLRTACGFMIHVTHIFSSASEGSSTEEEDEIAKDEDDSEEAFIEEEKVFDPAHCLFCNHTSSCLDDNLAHMSTHGMTIPEEHRLLVDIESLIGYLHLVIFGYFECLYCGSQRRNVQAVQQHMLGQRHCRFDISNEDSDFRDFYDFDSQVMDTDDGSRTSAPDSILSVVRTDEATLRLPSGRILSHRSSPHTKRQRNQPESGSTSSTHQSIVSTSQHTGAVHLSRAETRDQTLVNHLVRLRADDRRSLMHLPTSQQRALLTTQKKQLDMARKAERAMQGRLQGKANKTSMKHFVNDVPGRSNG